MSRSSSSQILVPDVQARLPGLAVSLSQVGVTGVEKVIRIRQSPSATGGPDGGPNGGQQLFWARFECVVELGPDQKGAHMSRFEEVVNEAIREVVLGEVPFKAETLAEHIARLVRERQGARRAEVTVHARFPEHKPAPVSGILTQELYTLHGCAVATELGTRRLIGVTAQGMTACPCAQELIAAGARENLAEEGFDASEIERILEAVPVATHNQRGLGTLHIGCPEECTDVFEAADLLRIVEGSMSSEIYELMKRSDEAHVVEKAHRRPRFVEDCVREMIRGVLETYPELDGAAFVSARQENLETIHQHNVIAERFGTLAEIRDELRAGTPAPVHTSRRAWLDASA
jgi:GTP cyclohydrolase IV